MAKFYIGQTVYSASGKAYRIKGVYDHVLGTNEPVPPHPTKGVRYGVQGMRDGKPFGPFRNLWDTTAFPTKPAAIRQPDLDREFEGRSAIT